MQQEKKESDKWIIGVAMVCLIVGVYIGAIMVHLKYTCY